MADLNSINVTGRATKDVELRKTTSGKDVASLSIAVNGYQDSVDYFDVVIWGKTAQIAAQYVQRGKQVAINGRLQQRKWKDNDGATRYAVEIVANQLTLLGGGDKSDRPLQQHEVLSKSKEIVLEDLDDTISLENIPF